MRVKNQKIEEYRLPDSDSLCGNNGRFLIPFRSFELRIIASDGMDWDHVSVSLSKRCPNWEEMCFVKDLFFDPDETVIQFHPAISEYVNNHPYCLHLWRSQTDIHVLPPSILTGIKT